MADTTHSMDRPQLKPNAKDEYSKKSQQFTLRKSQSEPHSSYSTEVNNSGYKNYAHLSSPGQVADCLTRQDKDSRPHNMPISQPRPPSSSGHPSTGNRPPSSTNRPPSARRYSRQDSANMSSEDLTDRPSARPPSSFSKYQPLPAIGVLVSSEKLDTSSNNHLHNIMRNSTLSRQHSSHHLKQDEENSNKKSNKKLNETTKNTFQKSEMATMLDNSVLSRRTITHIKSAEAIAGAEPIERLDLTQLNKSDGEFKRKTHPNNLTPNTSKGNLRHNSTKDNADLYDGDDDDSDTPQFSASKHGSNITFPNPAKTTAKKPVIIPSPDSPPTREVMLAVKLPTDGTRHQKYFNSNESLQAIVEFAEEMAGQSFNGYVLVVASPPNSVFVDLEDTIENAGLEDKTVFHLEEYDWTD